jgi:hypothetical protein
VAQKAERAAGASGGSTAARGGDPLLSELMPWSVPAVRPGRAWVRAADPDTLRARWHRLIAAGEPERAVLFRPSRARTLRTAVPQLPGQATSTVRLAREQGPCPEPVQVRHGAFDRQWLLPDHRLLDAARPELWRVADVHQLFAVVQPREPDLPGPSLVFSAELPIGSPGRNAGPVLPLYRRPGGQEPNLAPGLADVLRERWGVEVTPLDVAAWLAAVCGHPAVAAPQTAGSTGTGAPGVPVPLPADPDLWLRGTALGRRALWLMTFGARCVDPAEDRPAGRPRMPGGQRPFVRRAVPPSPAGLPSVLGYDAGDRALVLGEGRVAPVPPGAWEYRVGGEPVLAAWFAERAGAVQDEPGSLEAVRPEQWPQAWTTELIDLSTVLALLGRLHGEQAVFARELDRVPRISAAELRDSGVLPPPGWAARPASVLDQRQEGPEGQFALF